MNDIFRSSQDMSALVCLDGISVYRKTKHGHFEHLEKCFKILRDNKLYDKMSKSELFMSQIQILGRVGTESEVEVDKGSLKSV